MFPKRKLFQIVLLTALFAVLISGATSILAQSDTDSVPPTVSRGWGWHTGMGSMHGGSFGPGMMQYGWMPFDDPMMVAVADVLDLDINTLATQLQSGNTIAQLAQERSVDLQTLHTTMVSVMADQLSAAVGAGYLTQQQADAQLSYMQENIGQMPMFDAVAGDFFAPCPMHSGAFQMFHMGRFYGQQNQGFNRGWMGRGMHR